MCTWSVCVGNVCLLDRLSGVSLFVSYVVDGVMCNDIIQGRHMLTLFACWCYISDINTMEFLYSSGSCKASRWYVHMCGSRQGVLLAQHLNGNGKIA